jgi:8-oxo-dGTP pyrophosphatase MutT (NUDIX family)
LKLKPWKCLDRSLVFSAQPWVEVYKERVLLPQGEELDDFYRVLFAPSVVIVPVTSAGELVLVKAYRHGLGAMTLSAPAGMIEPDESPLDAAKRELLEETGYSGSVWTELAHFCSDINREGSHVHIFLALEVVKTAQPLETPSEQLEVQLITTSDFLNHVFLGEIGSITTIAAVHLASGKQFRV